MAKVEITIVMNENGSMDIKSNTGGAHLIGVMVLAQNAVMKDLMGPPRAKETGTVPKEKGHDHPGEKGVKGEPGMAVVPKDGPQAEEKLANQKDNDLDAE